MKEISNKLNHSLFNKLVAMGLSDFYALILANRVNSLQECKDILYPSVKKVLILKKKFKDLAKASKRIMEAFYKKEIIGIETDYDCDGLTAHAMLYETLLYVFKHPKSLIKSYVGRRLKDGYGFNINLAKKVIKDRVSLVITADNGSSSVESLLLLKSNNIDVIVTDHHCFEHSINNAYAFINPSNIYKHISGCFVAWILVADLVIKSNLSKSILFNFLDLVCLSTLSDCMSLAESPNRYVVQKGIDLINKKNRSCWFFINKKVDVSYLQFYLVPIINACSRVSDARDGLKFLLSKNKSWLYLGKLQNNNKLRKNFQKQVYAKTYDQVKYCKDLSIVYYQKESNPGINGLIASKLVNKFGKPVIIFSASHVNNLYTGSARSIPQVNIKLILDKINACYPNIIYSYGGHELAAGISLYDLDKFKSLFNQQLSQIISIKDIGPKIYIEGSLLSNFALQKSIRMLSKIEPFGTKFRRPCFKDIFIVTSFYIKNEHTYINLVSELKENVKAIYFNKVCYFTVQKPYLFFYELGYVLIVRLFKFLDAISSCST